MTLLHRLASIVRWIARRERAEQDLNDELQVFIDMAAAEEVRDGATAAEARRRAALQLGGLEQAKERVRSGRHGAWLDMAGRDIRYGLRQLRRNPAFSAIAIATLALSIGGITAIFSAFDTILLRPLPYPDADRLVMVWDDMSKSEGDSTFFSTPAEWAEWRRLNTVFTDLACSQPGNAILSGDGEPEEVRARKVTWNLWSVLGVQPALGRVFTEDEDDKRRARGRVESRAVAAPLRRRIGHRRTQDLGKRRGLRSSRRHAAELLLHALARHRHVDASVVSSRLAREFHVAQCPDRRTPQTRSHAGTRKAVHGRLEPAGDGEGLPRAALGDHDPCCGKRWRAKPGQH